MYARGDSHSSLFTQRITSYEEELLQQKEEQKRFAEKIKNFKNISFVEKVLLLPKLEPGQLQSVLAQLPPAERKTLFSKLKPWLQATLFQNLNPQTRESLFDALDSKKKTKLLQALPTEVQIPLLSKISPEEKKSFFEQQDAEQLFSLYHALEPTAQVALLNALEPNKQIEIFLQLDWEAQKAVFHSLDKERADALLETLSDEIEKERILKQALLRKKKTQAFLKKTENDRLSEFNQLEQEAQLQLFKRLPVEAQFPIFTQLDPYEQKALLAPLPWEAQLALFQQLDKQQQTDCFNYLDEEVPEEKRFRDKLVREKKAQEFRALSPAEQKSFLRGISLPKSRGMKPSDDMGKESQVAEEESHENLDVGDSQSAEDPSIGNFARARGVGSSLESQVVGDTHQGSKPILDVEKKIFFKKLQSLEEKEKLFKVLEPEEQRILFQTLKLAEQVEILRSLGTKEEKTFLSSLDQHTQASIQQEKERLERQAKRQKVLEDIRDFDELPLADQIEGFQALDAEDQQLYLLELSPGVISTLLPNLPETTQVGLFREITLTPEEQQSIFQFFSHEEQLRIFNQLPAAVELSLFSGLNQAQKRSLFHALSQEKQEDLFQTLEPAVRSELFSVLSNHLRIRLYKYLNWSLEEQDQFFENEKARQEKLALERETRSKFEQFIAKPEAVLDHFYDYQLHHPRFLQVFTVILGVIGMVVALTFTIRFFKANKPIEPIVTKIEGIKRLGEMHLVKQKYESVIPISEKRFDKNEKLKRENLQFLLIAPIEVTGYIDFNKLTMEVNNSDSLLSIQLPEAKVSKAYLDFSRTVEYRAEGNMKIFGRQLKRINHKEAYFDIARGINGAKEKVILAAKDKHFMLEQTQKMAQIFVRNIATTLGYRVVFSIKKEEPEGEVPPENQATDQPKEKTVGRIMDRVNNALENI